MPPSRPTGLFSPALEGGVVVESGRASDFPGSSAKPLGTYERLRALGSNSLVVAVLSPFLALTVGYVPRILLAIVILDIPFQFGTHLFYREGDDALGALAGLSISSTTMALAGLYLSWLMRALANRKSELRPRIHFSPALLSYIAIVLLSVLVAQDATLSLFEVFLLVQASLVYVYVANFVRTRQDVQFVVSVLLIGCLLESLAMIALKINGMPTAIWGLPSNIHWIHMDTDARLGFARIGGTIGSPNTAGAYLSIVLATAAALQFTSLGRVHKWLAALVLGVGGVALIFTFSRGAWIAFAVSIAVLCFVAWHRRGLSLKAPIAIIMILTLLYLPFHESISGRLLGDDRGSAESRIPLMNLAFRIIEDNPVLGVGANNFTVVMSHYLTPEFRRGFLFAVHNKYLLILSETGIGGLLAFLAFLLGAMRKGWRCWRLQDRFLSPLALGFTAALVGHMLQMGVDVFRGRPIQQLVWLVAGLLTAMYGMCARQSSSNSAPGVP
jgi:O-antigen ligase